MSEGLYFERPKSELVTRVLDAHGGFDLWDRAAVVRARMSTGGAAFRLKFSRDYFRDTAVTVFLKEARVEIRPYAGRDRVGHYDRNGVKITDEEDNVVAARSNPRPYFRKRRRLLWWDHLDTLYFSGYACWNYLSMPYLLTLDGLKLAEGEPWTEAGETWQRLDATFPRNVDTHSTRQSFYFDDRGYLRRHDYTAEVFGDWAKAAHYCYDHLSTDGAVFPTRRRVVPRAANHRPRPFPTLVWIRAHEVKLGRGADRPPEL